MLGHRLASAYANAPCCPKRPVGAQGLRARAHACALSTYANEVHEGVRAMRQTVRKGPGRAPRRGPLGPLERADELLRAFADPTRLRILHLLLGGETCVGDLESVLGLPQSTTSRHLAYLRRDGLVAACHTGHWVFYALAQPRGALHETLLRCLSARLGGAPELERDLRRLARMRARGACCQPASVKRGATTPHTTAAGRIRSKTARSRAR
jgi:ArsR family transcriptional regulator